MPFHDTVLFLYRGGLLSPCGLCTQRGLCMPLGVSQSPFTEEISQSPLGCCTYKGPLWIHCMLYKAPRAFIHTYTHFDLFSYFHLQSLYTEELHKVQSSFAHIEGLCTPIYTHFSLFFPGDVEVLYKAFTWRGPCKVPRSYVKPLYRRALQNLSGTLHT